MQPDIPLATFLCQNFLPEEWGQRNETQISNLRFQI